MPDLYEDTNPKFLKDLLGQIHTSETALPDFQRDFVWEPSATRDLIVSIANEYPAGSLLRIRNTLNLFKPREFYGAPQLKGHKPNYLVLDGQQRLTSLYNAFYGVGDHRYFLKLKGLLDNEDFEDCIFYLRANHARALELASTDKQYATLVLPLTVLQDGLGGFTDWVLEAVKLPANAARQKPLLDLRKKWMEPTGQYRFPVVTLADSTGAEAVCTIFETLNRTGVKLSPFELLAARFWPRDINLRELWKAAVDRHPVLAEFEIDPYYILQVVSLLSRPVPSCKRGEVLKLTGDAIKTWWTAAAEGMGEGLTLLKEECGVLVPRWLPYNTIVIPLAAACARTAKLTGPAQGARRSQLARWYWCSVFSQAYETAANTQSARDLIEIQAWIKGGPPPATVTNFAFDPSSLRSTTVRQRALYAGTIGLLLRRRPPDFHTRQNLTGDLISKGGVEDHHIFPNAFLKKLNVADPLRDCVLNRTLIDRQTNKSIGQRAPSKYLKDVSQAHGPSSFDALMGSHLLPSGGTSPLSRDAFDDFLSWRQNRIWQEIQQVTG